MTYCVGIKLNAGLVFLSDSRTNAGVDHISTFRKMIVYERPGDRFMVLLSAGNLTHLAVGARDPAGRAAARTSDEREPITIWNAKSMFDAARVLGRAVRHVYDRDAEALKHAGVDFNVVVHLRRPDRAARACACSWSIRPATSSRPRARRPTSRSANRKYGKPVLDRVITPDTPLDEAAKCALVSMDSTHEVEPLGRPAARPGGLRGQPPAAPTRSSASTTRTPTSA